MTTLIESILLGIGNFPFFAILFTLPIIAGTIIRHKAVNFVRIGFDYLFLLYMLCVIALTLFPLPTAEQAAMLHNHNIQLIPFHFIADIIRESPLQIMNVRTYLPAMFHETILQVVFNVLMTIPFGMFLSYACGYHCRKVVVLSLMLSVVIEFTQFTGIYGIYNGSYRLCDVDDLMANTLGGFLGYELMTVFERILPRLEVFDLKIAKRKELAIHHN